jgi:hypothetical protein
MGEPIYRWMCTYCRASDLAESPEMARLAVDVHVSLFHTPAARPVRAQAGPGAVLVEDGLPSGDDHPQPAEEPSRHPSLARTRVGAVRRLLRRALGRQ